MGKIWKAERNSGSNSVGNRIEKLVYEMTQERGREAYGMSTFWRQWKNFIRIE